MTIKKEGGLPELIRLLRKTTDEDVMESITAVLWNMSSCEVGFRDSLIYSDIMLT